jgi:hypothetical protein
MDTVAIGPSLLDRVPPATIAQSHEKQEAEKQANFC